MSAADANRNFSRLLREVRAGRSYVITSHGRPVAKMVPIASRDRIVAAARRTLLHRLRMQSATAPIGRWTREELYPD